MLSRAASRYLGRHHLRPALQTRAQQSQQRRLASSTNEPPSPTRQFYGTFGRPVAKVFLMAIFVYQLAYWGWVKLEQDETRADRQAEISNLEAKVQALQSPGKKQ